jgi:hypothetical protein
MGLTTIERDTYWKRRRIEPHPYSDAMATSLYQRIPVGTFVKIIDVGKPHLPVDVIEYGLIGPEKKHHWDTTYRHVFGIYFQRVTDEAELGLIKLAEQET